MIAPNRIINTRATILNGEVNTVETHHIGNTSCYEEYRYKYIF